ncbi:Antigen 43 precursor [compost metagenome]
MTGDPTINVNTGLAALLTGTITDGPISGDLVKTGGGLLALGGANTYTGPTTVRQGTMQAATLDTFSAASAHIVQGDGALDLNGYKQTVASLSNAGRVMFNAAGSSAGTTLTVSQAYTSNEGSLWMNSMLHDEQSVTDKLVTGSVAIGTGPTRVMVNNLGGLGALTTGDGIQIVQVADARASAAGAFVQGNRIAAGAYEYMLYQNGLQDSTVADGNWYLRSTLADVPGPDSGTPDYRREVPLNMAVPALVNRFGRDMLSTYHDRNGENFNPGHGNAYALSSWGRVFGVTGKAGKRGYDAFVKQGPSYDYDVAGFQAGHDLIQAVGPTGTRDIAGVYLGVGTASGAVDAVTGGRAGSLSMNGTALGGYWTRQGKSGWYVDAVVQGTIYSDIKTRSSGGQRSNTDGWGALASIEAGYPFSLGNDWSLEPQAQLVYQHVAIDGTKDDFGRVQFGDTDGAYGRLGARLTKQINTKSGEQVTGWVRANVWQHMGADARTTFSTVQGTNSVTLDTSLGGTWAQIGLGVSGQLSKNVSVFAAADYNQSLGSRDGQGVSGRMGMRIRW